MSLLMDALKRAENAKQESARNPQGGTLPTASDLLSLEPYAPEPAKGATNPLPDLASHLAAVDAELASSTLPDPQRTAPQPGKPPAKPAETREAVRNAFAAKLTPAAPSRLPLWLALGTLAIAGIAIGGYVWYQMNAMSRGSLAVSATAPLAQPAPSSAPRVVPAVPLAPPSDFAPFSRSTVEVADEPPARPLFPRREALALAMPAPEDESSGQTPIRLTRTQPEPDLNLTRGYASLQRGDIDLSRREFEQAIQRDPNNTDALLALAAIAQRQGRTADADGLRQRALVANPSDPATQAAVLNNLSANADPTAVESRLKSLLSSQPESAPLNFALGNLYSRQGRWSEAQQVYFNAVAAESDNPDYLFNLAVSLDHLRQARLAAQHYRLALEAATKRPAGFAPEKLQRRLSELHAERQP
ncbi:MAG: tetratricopeptide repeat protein [Gammaproteobacteria bacterium]|nr:tetratricopeptide repeat protein [Gammaproteobacteria bacterium]MBU1601142.1 tetratricopeptide repeat protein [Gammaproteobacteria bacterium]MBU2434501.1 tetratricopeptide repeat protein [Gammaproteobacteria bacterium]MBU2450905.1 tetratricopeptide repeat protein [Gammaproteobacteria bacterium]